MTTRRTPRSAIAGPADSGPTPERRQHGAIERLERAIGDVAGHPSRPYRAVDTLAIMQRRGSITAGMRQAGEDFRARFAVAQLDPLRALDLSHLRLGERSVRPAGDGPGLRIERARAAVWRAVQAVGGIASPAGSCLWHVIGWERSLKEWALERGWSGRRVSQEAASGILIAALGALEAHFGIAHELSKSYFHVDKSGSSKSKTGNSFMTVCELPAVIFDGVIDVSHHNGAIDWSAVAGAGIALVFIKATQGVGFVDPAFERNRSAAVNAGVLVVPYHFLDTSDPDRQAEHFLAVTDLGEGQPAMLDWETAATAAALVAIGRAVADRIGRDPVAYYGFAQLQEASLDLSRWPLMLPEYPRGIAPGRYLSLVRQPPHLPPGRSSARPYDFHQYTPAGRVAGIATQVDRSVWVGSLADLRAWFATGALPPAKGAAPPAG
jgi:GH25 family lysozyme M1 (1,4-beta-N-acetylmuramidase)